MKKLIAAMLVAAMLGGCAQQADVASSEAEKPSSSASEVEAASSSNSEEAAGEKVDTQKDDNKKEDSNTIVGKVTAIDGSQITLEVKKDDEKTITIADTSKIMIEKDGESTEGALADITADAMISVEFADDGETVTTVTVKTGAPDEKLVPEGKDTPEDQSSVDETSST